MQEANEQLELAPKAQTSEPAEGPVELDPALWNQVVGGMGPHGGWAELDAGPHGGW